MKAFRSASLIALAAAAVAAPPAAARSVTVEDVTMLSRVAAPAVSRDGRWRVWLQREADLAAAMEKKDANAGAART
jgi:hypothetical protein